MDPEANAGPTGKRSQLLGACAYLLGPISAAALLGLERSDRFVRYHALQSLLASIVLACAGGLLNLLGRLPLVGFLYAYSLRLFLLAIFVLWIWVVMRALAGGRARLPWIGGAIERYLY